MGWRTDAGASLLFDIMALFFHTARPNFSPSTERYRIKVYAKKRGCTKQPLKVISDE